VVRAAFLRWLATDPDAAPHIDCKGIRVYAATLLGNFDLEGSRVPVRLDFRRCTAKGENHLEQAETQDILFLTLRWRERQASVPTQSMFTVCSFLREQFLGHHLPGRRKD